MSPPYEVDSANVNIPGIKGTNTTAGTGVFGESQAGDGVVGLSRANRHAGVSATNDSGGFGVWARGFPGGHFESAHVPLGISAVNQNAGVFATNDTGGFGVWARGTPGGHFESAGSNGVHGQTGSATDSGVWGENTGGGYGVSGSTNSQFQPGAGVTAGVWGNNSGSGAGVKGTSPAGDGVLGFSHALGHAGVSAVNDSRGENGYGLWASGTPAGHFEGDVEVLGNVIAHGDVQLLLQNQDCAEDFEMVAAEEIGPGSVVVIDSAGALKQSDKAYDKRVAGVISGAGDCRPGIILGRQHVRENRMPIALLGKVYCKVDASREPIEVGDLLTTSLTPGHVMKAVDPFKAFGSVIGKALKPLADGCGLIPVLVALQ